MKIFQTFDILVVIFALIFIVGPVNSCEQPCRDGISNAFTDKWKGEVTPIFQKFRANVTAYLYYGMSLDKISDDKKVIDQVTRELATEVYNDVNNFTDTFIFNMNQTIQTAIFVVSPAFLGDCKHQVTQPPKNVNWTMKDCVAMDFICGNPPSICHFFDTAKQKCFNLLSQNITNNSTPDGDYIKAIQASVKTIAKKYSLTSDGTQFLNDSVTKNVQSSLDGFPTKYSTGFCPDGCPKFDQEIKNLLLSFP
ncbi:42325_t:CDS:1 [Gigaspora margarita]|uniref:42325_t:CDS:1 n=1 Tax=Gigaspora margarita TaxID=4874 RepID=A0ABN7VXH3_GIGMA|nr:42325_t:CDS:1 [Gigaspora margarita]